MGTTEQRGFLQSKKGGGALVGSAAAAVTAVSSSNILPEGSPWYAVIILCALVSLPSLLQILAQTFLDHNRDNLEIDKFKIDRTYPNKD